MKQIKEVQPDFSVDQVKGLCDFLAFKKQEVENEVAQMAKSSQSYTGTPNSSSKSLEEEYKYAQDLEATP